jgi:hypothetical protein
MSISITHARYKDVTVSRPLVAVAIFVSIEWTGGDIAV